MSVQTIDKANDFIARLQAALMAAHEVKSILVGFAQYSNGVVASGGAMADEANREVVINMANRISLIMQSAPTLDGMSDQAWAIVNEAFANEGITFRDSPEPEPYTGPVTVAR
ncbi:hypothetical protein [Serratia marcescens]|uniref:hypothetical protein n=1 Tax=Serratia marcescens TaxID=615 RepID=UPI000FD786AF|nr:hypothetical protein [Serratia marcescens]